MPPSDRAAVASRLARTVARTPVAAALDLIAGVGLTVGLAARVLAVATPEVARVATARHAHVVAAATPARADASRPNTVVEHRAEPERAVHSSASPVRAAARPPPPHVPRPRVLVPTVPSARVDAPPVLAPRLREGDPSAAFARLTSFVESYGDRAHARDAATPGSLPGRVPTP